MNCPCCGQPVLSSCPALVSLDKNTVAVGNKSLRLRPQEAEILYAIAEAWPGALSKDRLMQKLYGLGERDGSLQSTFVAISRLRKNVEPLGLGIPHTSSRSDTGGYSLVTK